MAPEGSLRKEQTQGERLRDRVQLSCRNRTAAFGIYDREREFPLPQGHTLRLRNFHHSGHNLALLEEQDIVPPVVSVTEVVSRGPVEIHYVMTYRENGALDYKKLVYRGEKDNKRLVASHDLGEPPAVEKVIAEIQTREEQEHFITPPRRAA